MGVSGRGEEEDGGCRVSEQAASGFSGGGSPASSLTDDGEVTSSARDGDCSFSSESESDEETMQVDENRHAGAGPLYELAAPLLAQLPVRTGLSKYYQGKSQSFTSLYHARCVEDLAKKTTPYITRMKMHRGHGAVVGTAGRPPSNSRHAPEPCRKTIAKKTTPRCSSDTLLSRARRTSLLHRGGKPLAAAHQSKKELSRC
ncbi:hypothetical protein GUJ93_ZPchr0030g33470 [Zizania palustris]|uniref:Uncharacterized protein n=1 Tax=Zizania palustris TaxID=103762 RepID=A0A8J5QZB3_ZIZPA|nr:hypothetical protein GUJ93_ZPchr0030g33470 [Zizania palustris]